MDFTSIAGLVTTTCPIYSCSKSDLLSFSVHLGRARHGPPPCEQSPLGERWSLSRQALEGEISVLAKKADNNAASDRRKGNMGESWVSRALAVGAGIVLAYVGLCIALLPLVDRHSAQGWSSSAGDDVVLANFSVSPDCVSGEEPGCSNKFFFGLATAPAHIEDDLSDAWLDFARGSDGTEAPVRAWQNVPFLDQRLRFWTEPEIELDLAQNTRSTVFRLGIDWGRLVPGEPIYGTEEAADRAAVERYKAILQAIRDRGMKVMLTLFHHSLPKWAIAYGGWTERRTVVYFVDFAQFAQEEFGEYVDYWITFNQPDIFVKNTYCAMTWPPGGETSTLDNLLCYIPPSGAYGIAMLAITDAHKRVYEALHGADCSAVVGVALHAGMITPYGLLDIPLVLARRWWTEFQWTDAILDHLDFCGINYYGQEILSTAGWMLSTEDEYNEAGKSVYPQGLFDILSWFHHRYRAARPDLRFIVTENGFADDDDLLRRSFARAPHRRVRRTRTRRPCRRICPVDRL